MIQELRKPSLFSGVLPQEGFSLDLPTIDYLKLAYIAKLIQSQHGVDLKQPSCSGLSGCSHSECGSVDVQQKPPIQVTLLKEGISIPCEVKFPYMPKYTKFSIYYYRINSLDQKTSIYNSSKNVDIPPGQQNSTATLSYSYRIAPLENTASTGTYYCEVKWSDSQKKGNGVFVLVRVSQVGTSWVKELESGKLESKRGYQEWGRKDLESGRRKAKTRAGRSGKNQPNILRQNVETQLPSASPLPPPVYDSLNVQQVDVYSSLENSTNNPPQRKSPPAKTPKKQEALEEFSDTLYENI
ncbi:NFAT activation molecule 1 isoform X1 [Turdus rufiventris]|nr:NFAT activation molecule 1 isoform X1 [Turdus rufiventris]